MNEETVEEVNEESSEWKLLPIVTADSGALLDVEKSVKRVFVGAGARVLFYPTLLYNVVRNKLQPEFRWWDQIHQFLLLGAVPFPGDVHRLKSIGVKGVVTLNESYETLVPTSLYQKHGIDHLVIPTRDYLFAPSLGDIRQAVAFIHDHVQRGETTYVHCKAGRGRSTTVVLCYLVEHQGMTPMDAFQYVRAKRPRVLLATAQWQAVQEYSKQVGSSFGPQMSISVPLRSPPVSKANLLLETFNTVANTESETPVEDSDVLSSDTLDELPVVVTSLDLAGYRSIEDAGLVGNDLWKELGVVYRVRLMAARNVVNAVGVARASVEWARLSCLFLGCQAESNRVLGSHSSLTVDSFRPSEVSHTNSMAVPTLLREQLSMARLNFSVYQPGMVNGYTAEIWSRRGSSLQQLVALSDASQVVRAQGNFIRMLPVSTGHLTEERGSFELKESKDSQDVDYLESRWMNKPP